MIADAWGIVAGFLLVGVVATKMVTVHMVRSAKSELAKLELLRAGAVDRLNAARERRLSAESNVSFLERRKSDGRVECERLQYEIEELSRQVRPASPEGEASSPAHSTPTAEDPF